LVHNTLLDDPTPKEPQHSPLDSWHRALGARMVAFAGWSMPVQYGLLPPLAARCRGGILAEHLHCRSKAALFDVSHMGQAMLTGGAAAATLERLTPADISGLKPGRQRYTLLLNEAGGIIDDLMVANLGGERLFLVVNAARRGVDLPHIVAALPDTVTLTELGDRALLALQGPASAQVLSRFCPPAASLPFMGLTEAEIAGLPCIISRSGYTGEDGFEISIPASRAESLANILVDQPEVVPAGLGARDTLRLEAGLCLYGNDIDELTSPIEAGLAWVIGKRRRSAWDFPGAAVIRDQLTTGPHRLRVGLRPDGGAPARAGADIIAEDGTAAGTITSGGFSPTLNAPIAMGYVRRDLATPGVHVNLMVRGRALPAQVVALPFVPHRYVK
jgi:aminomethyltransferase